MNTKTFFLVFCLTIVILGIVTSSASADNTTVTTTATPTPTTATPTPTTATPTPTTATPTPTTATPTPTTATPTPTTATPTPTTATPTPTATTALPVVSSVSPASGTTLGGTVVTITGSGFTDLTTVMFGSTAATSYTFISDSEITAIAPAEAVGTVAYITVVTPSGTSLTSTAYEFTYTAATTTVPTVTSISPTYGPVSVATPITITGTGFTGATGVTVGGTAATSVVVVSSTEITATTPASSSVGQVDVLVSTPSGTSGVVSGDQYTFAAAATTVPLPIFYAAPTSGLAPLEVSFTDQSTGSPATWSWNFGDGNTSTIQDPTNTYANNGTYSVTLTEENAEGENATTMTDYITVGGSGPVADFSATPTSGTAPLTVQFTDTSTGSPATWLWDFGDGTTGTDESPSHVYTSPGVYSITLTATNGAGTNTYSQPDAITVSSLTAAPTVSTPPPTAVNTFAITATQASASSNAAWLAQQNAMSTQMAVATTPASALPPVISLVSLACVALFIRKKHP
jgi:large repetitive protein